TPRSTGRRACRRTRRRSGRRARGRRTCARRRPPRDRGCCTAPWPCQRPTCTLLGLQRFTLTRSSPLLTQRTTRPYAAAMPCAPQPQSAAGREAMAGVGGLQPAADEDEIVVPLESGLGVWIVPAAVNGQRGRFLLDTGSSVIVVGPTLAAAAGLAAAPGRAT